MIPSAALLVMVPEGSPQEVVDCEVELPLVSCPRSIMVSEWSWLRNTGVNVSVWVVVTPRLLFDEAVVRLLCFDEVSFQPVVLSESGMNSSLYWLKMLKTTFPS